ncbi:hypothetical protein [Methylosinus sp. PW1]|uniref:hypothetical protein n=1 Tax=Methylosinus sp. PW1 TaxID=107636 RepID=UPI0012EC90BF|nr:hypothetical protein [Methylosinus sp. PW1]
MRVAADVERVIAAIPAEERSLVLLQWSARRLARFIELGVPTALIEEQEGRLAARLRDRARARRGTATGQGAGRERS